MGERTAWLEALRGAAWPFRRVGWGLRRRAASVAFRTSGGCPRANGGRGERGQGTVEAAFVIPVMFLLMLMLLQPGIVLYDRIVMGGAAAEGCRLLATSTDALGSMQGSCEAFVRHRLAAVPQHDCFHVHSEGCSWRIEMSGDESSEAVTVRIGNELKPLPLFDAGSRLLGMTNATGHLTIEEEVTMPTKPSWTTSSPSGTEPSDWPGAWLS